MKSALAKLKTKHNLKGRNHETFKNFNIYI